MSVGGICSREVISVLRADSLRTAAQSMRGHHVGALVVVDVRDGKPVPVGIVTDRDIVVGVVAKGLDADALRVEEVMSGDLVLARDTDGVAECAARMRANAVRRMPVVDLTGALIGIVTVDDVLQRLADELTALARIVGNERRREVHTRPA